MPVVYSPRQRGPVDILNAALKAMNETRTTG